MLTAGRAVGITDQSQRDYLELEIEQRRIDLRRAELALKQHDERAEMIGQKIANARLADAAFQRLDTADNYAGSGSRAGDVGSWNPSDQAAYQRPNGDETL